MLELEPVENHNGFKTATQININGKRNIGLFRTYGNLLERLQSTKEVFYQTSLLVHLLVIITLIFVTATQWYHRFAAPFSKSCINQSASKALSATSASNSLSAIDRFAFA